MRASLRPELSTEVRVPVEIRSEPEIQIVDSNYIRFATSWRLPATSKYRGRRLHLKRVFDVVVAALALVLVTPVMLILVLLVLSTSSGPVLFRQPRIGRHGRVFQMYKFRSMFTDAEAKLAADKNLAAEYRRNSFKLLRDPRLTPIGAFLRRSSLDELPQLVNVLRGHMSLVGPRPVVLSEFVAERDNDCYLYATPGMTGKWQVEGRSEVGYPERCELDNDYVATWGIRKDLLLLVKTLPALFKSRGAH